MAVTDYLRPQERAEKCVEEPGDLHRVGARCTVLGRLGPHEKLGDLFGYFVYWDDLPDVPAFVLAHKIRRSEETS